MRINKDQVTVSRLKALSFNYKRGRGHLFAYCLNRFKWHYYPRLRYVSKFPDHVDVEISSVCNMRCPMCYTACDLFSQNVQKKFMDLGLYKKIIDECSRYKIYSIRISLRGEPFIHKDVVSMISYAKEKGIKEVSALTNNLALNAGFFEEAMRAGLDWLTISFDGLGKTYEWIRQPACFDESYKKIKEYKQIKKRARSCKPVIKVQTVWPAIKNCSREYLDAFTPYVDEIAINPIIDYLHKDEEIIYSDKFECPVLYQRLVIGSDGIALLCSNDEFCLNPIGDTNKEPLYEIWHGEKMTLARKTHERYDGVKLLQPCRYCYLPRKTQPVREYIGKGNVVIDKYVNRPDEVGA